MYIEEDDDTTGPDPEVIIHETPPPQPMRPKQPQRMPSAPIGSVAAHPPVQPRLVSSPPSSVAPDEGELEEDHGLKKEQYMISSDQTESPGRRKRDKTKAFTQFFTKIKDRIVSAVSSEDEPSPADDVRYLPPLLLHSRPNPP